MAESEATTKLSSVIPKNFYAPKEVIRQRIFLIVAFSLMVVALVFSSIHLDLDFRKLISNFPKSIKFFLEFFPPNISNLRLYAMEMLKTIEMAFWGTFLAFLLAVPLSILAAINTTPNAFAYQIARRTSDFMRGLNEFVLALFFVVAVSIGSFPGVLALFIHTTGILVKLFSEGIEDVDKGQIEALEATGATPLQIFTHAIWPQITPHVVSMTLYRFESNVRAATVLGLVGAGGIGYHVQETIRSFNFGSACTIIIIILLAVFLIDSLSARLRRQLV